MKWWLSKAEEPVAALKGNGSFEETVAGLRWLREQGASTAIAGRLRWGDDDGDMRKGYAALFAREKLKIDTTDHGALVIFPDAGARVFLFEIDTGEMPVARSDLTNPTQNCLLKKALIYETARKLGLHTKLFGWKNFRVTYVTTTPKRARYFRNQLAA